MDFKVREIKESELYLLDEFLYNAIFQGDNEESLPRDITNNDNLQVYIKGFGKSDDVCLVAETDGKVVGCVWTRIYANELKGYGSIDDKTPELAISVLKEYRKNGIGYKLMKDMLEELKKRRYEKVSLSVQKINYALKMYLKLGFKVIEEDEEEDIMIYELNK